MAHDDLPVAVVTGGAGGIGRALALRLARDGFAIGVLDRDRAGADATCDAVVAAGGYASAVTADVTDEAQVARAFGDLKAPSRPDACSSTTPAGTSSACSRKAIPRPGKGSSTSTTAACCSARTPRLADVTAAGNRGRISSVSSYAARVGSCGEAVYSGCKASIIGFSKALARELARDLVPVNVVCPGPIDTALLKSVGASEQGAKIVAGMSKAIPFRRLGTPDEIAEAVAFFASPAAGFITGQVLSVSGGLTMAG
jgi:2-hydroxycyclohexanecarboxyl-CoA dehydrogenase